MSHPIPLNLALSWMFERRHQSNRSYKMNNGRSPHRSKWVENLVGWGSSDHCQKPWGNMFLDNILRGVSMTTRSPPPPRNEALTDNELSLRTDLRRMLWQRELKRRTFFPGREWRRWPTWSRCPRGWRTRTTRKSRSLSNGQIKHLNNKKIFYKLIVEGAKLKFSNAFFLKGGKGTMRSQQMIQYKCKYFSRVKWAMWTWKLDNIFFLNYLPVLRGSIFCKRKIRLQLFWLRPNWKRFRIQTKALPSWKRQEQTVFLNNVCPIFTN